MAPVVLFELVSANHFVASTDRTTIDVYELNSAANPSTVTKFDWNKVAIVIVTPPPDHHHYYYDGLKLFNKEIKDPHELKNLAADLAHSHLMVNPHGNSYLHVSSSSSTSSSLVDPTFGVAYYRVNDIFPWSRRYGVTDLPPATVATVWSQHRDMMFPARPPVVDYEDQLKRKDDDINSLLSDIAARRREVEAAAAELERCRKWNNDLISSGCPVVPSGAGAFVKLQERRLAVLPTTFLVSSSSPAAAAPASFRVPLFDGVKYKDDVPFDGFSLVDQECRGLPAPPTVRVRTRGGWFDTRNWWYVMARGGKYLGGYANRMLVVYDGEFGYAEVQNSRSNKREKVPVPYKLDGEFAADRNFDLVFSPTDEIRVGFTYRW